MCKVRITEGLLYLDGVSHSVFAKYISLYCQYFCYISSTYMYLFSCHMKQDKQSPIQDATITSVHLAFSLILTLYY